MNYKHIVFDFGNVLATFQSDDLLYYQAHYNKLIFHL